MRSRRRAMWILLGVLVVAAGVAVPLAILRGDRVERLVASVEVLDFGRIAHGDQDSRTFRLRNQTARPVTIQLVLANCPCFRVDQSYAHLLQPGEETAVRVHIDAGLVPATVLRGKQLTVPSDDPSGLLVVPIRAEVFPVLRVEPEVVEFGRVTPEASPKPSRTVTVRATATYRIGGLNATVSPADVFELKRVDAEGGADLTVSLRPAARGTGPVRGGIRITAEVSGEKFESRRIAMTIPVTLEWQ